MKILSYSKYHIDTVITNGDEILWFTGIFGHPKHVEKHHTWTLLRRLAQLSSVPSICGGDFNQILHMNEK